MRFPGEVAKYSLFLIARPDNRTAPTVAGMIIARSSIQPVISLPFLDELLRIE